MTLYHGAVTTENVVIMNFFDSLCTVTENIFAVTLSMERIYPKIKK